MADITEPLAYGTITGKFQAVVEDSVDVGRVPDTIPLVGDVTFTPSYRNLRVRSTDTAESGIAYVQTVTAQVVDGILVDDLGTPGVSLLAATDELGPVFPHNISWTASFNLTMSDGTKLASQPESTQIQLSPGETKVISDFVPSMIQNSSISITTVDRDTLNSVNSQVEYITNMVESLELIVEEGVVKGDPGPKGDPGDEGPQGPVGPSGRPGAVETVNYVKNPVPTSNSGYQALNGTATYTTNKITLASTSTARLPELFWTTPVKTYPGTNMYLEFTAVTTSTVPLKSTIVFLDAKLVPVSYDVVVHSGSSDVEIPSGSIDTSASGTFTHAAQTNEAASFAIFSVGFSASTAIGTSIDVSKFYFSDVPGFYFSGADVIAGYNIRWTGAANNSYSALIPSAMVTSGAVHSVNSMTGDVVITAGTLGLDQVSNTSDENKPISLATQAALDTKANTADIVKTVTSADKRLPQSSYLVDFPRFGTQEVWRTENTYVDISYTTALIGSSSFVRMVIPGSTTGNTASSIPTLETSTDGYTWTTWVTLTSAPASGITHTNISGFWDRTTSRLKVLVRTKNNSVTTDDVTLTLYTVTTGGSITSISLGTYTSTSAPYTGACITENPLEDGTMYMYYMDSAGAHRRVSVSATGTLGTTATALSGLKANYPAKVSRMYGAWVAAAADNSVANTPGLLVSTNGTSWRNRGLTGTHSWDRAANTKVMAAYPGVSKGKVGVFVEYLSAVDYKLSRLFACAGPTFSGQINTLATPAGQTSSTGSTITFPGTLPSIPFIGVSTNDSKLNLGVIGVTKDGATIERFNMGAADSANASVTWTVQG